MGKVVAVESLTLDGVMQAPGGVDDRGSDEHPTANPAEDAVQPVRDIDTLTPEDRERGARLMREVEATLAQRRADKADGVVNL